MIFIKQNRNLAGLSFGQDEEGKWGYKPSGADSVIPFSGSYKITITGGTVLTIGSNTTTIKTMRGTWTCVIEISGGEVSSYKLSPNGNVQIGDFQGHTQSLWSNSYVTITSVQVESL